MEVQMHLPAEANKLIGVEVKPKKRNLYYEATELDKVGKHEKAEAIYHELLANDFDNTVVLASLGMNYAQTGKYGLAFCVMQKALDKYDERFQKDLKSVGVDVAIEDKMHKGKFLKLKKSELCNAIGTTWKHENKIEQARYWFEKAGKILGEPNADIYNNLATLYINEGLPHKAIGHLEDALKADPNHPQAQWNLSLSHLEMGDYEKGFKLYSAGKRAAVRAERNYSVGTTLPTPEWDGTKGKTLVVYGEQGIGDEIMFASLLPDVMKDCNVIFECHKRLHRLFSHSFPDIPIYGTREDERIVWVSGPDGKPRYQIDAKIAIGDLPKFYRPNIESFPGTPYINPTAEASVKWAKKFNEVFTDGKPVIGINWKGGHKKTRVEVRSVTLEQMLPILSQDAHFVSLQYTDGCEQEIFEFEQAHGIKIHNWPEGSKNEQYDETGGMVANLDLVITVCSSIVHLAGSMGTPTWVLTPSRPAWRYRLDIDFMPWYGKTVTLFRQAPSTVDWEPVVIEVSDALKGLLSAPATVEKEDEIHRTVQTASEAIASDLA